MESDAGKRKGLSIVIGAGGVKCAAALGLWKVLREEGIEVSVAVGCSGGSMYASVIALGLDVDKAQELTLNFWRPEVMRGYTTNLRDAKTGAVRFTERSGLVDDGPLMAALETAFGDSTFEDVQLPLYIVATDFYSGERIVLSSGRLLDAVRSSLAIPTVWPPWEVDGRLLTDGAACDPLPVDVAIREGGQTILAMGFETTLRSRMGSLTAVTSQVNNIYANNLLRSSFAFYSLVHHNEVIPILPVFERPIGVHDTNQIPYIIEQGEQATREQLPYIRRLLESGS